MASPRDPHNKEFPRSKFLLTALGYPFLVGLREKAYHALLAKILAALTSHNDPQAPPTIDGVIRESHPVASEIGFSPYFQSMIRAYRLVTDFAARHDIQLVTIHPAAVYGGLNTGEGFTN